MYCFKKSQLENGTWHNSANSAGPRHSTAAKCGVLFELLQLILVLGTLYKLLAMAHNTIPNKNAHYAKTGT
ncbi:hypothetical protein C0J52_09946 [Blattella germanica]|nr:hypothetical protein C0J52_09946 [Blattella germanica]